MPYYESVNDEDYNEDTEDYNEDFNEDLGEDYNEDYAEAGDYTEARKRSRNRDRSRGRSGRRGRSRNLQNLTRIPDDRSIRKGFDHVSKDVTTLRKKVRDSTDTSSTQLGIETLVSALFPPTIERVKNPNWDKENPQPGVREYVEVVKDTLFPRTLITILASKAAGGNDVNLKKIMPWILGSFLISPGSFNQLNLNLAPVTGTGGTSGTGTASFGAGLFGSSNNILPLAALAGIFYLATKK